MTEVPIFEGAIPRFSLFQGGYVGKDGKVGPSPKPCGRLNLVEVYNRIRTDEAARINCQQLQQIHDDAECQEFKKLHFDSVTFCGLFSYRKINCWIENSGYFIIDIDKLSSLDEANRVKQILINDRRLKSPLTFLSPSYRGVKSLVAYKGDLKEAFNKVRKYLIFQYGIIEMDRSGSDCSRPCYLPYDENVYIDPKYLSL